MAKMGARSTNTSSRSIAQMGIGALVLGFVFLSWCVLVGGLSAVQHRGVHISDVLFAGDKRPSSFITPMWRCCASRRLPS